MDEIKIDFQFKHYQCKRAPILLWAKYINGYETNLP